MKEFEAYDDAVAEYLRKHPVLSAPLLSWDFLNATPYLSEDARDITEVLEFARLHDWDLRDDISSRLGNGDVVLITDSDIKIVYATRNMVRMNGFSPEEVIGKSPKEFQGSGTDLTTKARIRQAISERRPFEETLLNYLKDGRTYDCVVKGFPVFNKVGALVHFIAFESAA